MSDILFPPLLRKNDDHSSIGYVVGGGLKENLRVRLTVPAQEVQEGSFVIIDSADWRFYGLVTDLQLGTTDPRFADEQSETRLPGGLAALLHGQTLFTNLEVMPALMVESGPEPGSPRNVEWGKAPTPRPPATPRLQPSRLPTRPSCRARPRLWPSSSATRRKKATLSSATPAS